MSVPYRSPPDMASAVPNSYGEAPSLAPSQYGLQRQLPSLPPLRVPEDAGAGGAQQPYSSQLLGPAANALTATDPQPAAPSKAPAQKAPSSGKTFQCTGFEGCSMSFSRSEHLARHVRKHTGEKPFACRCGKNFTRLDNLRQHATTIHADEPEANEELFARLAANMPRSGARAAKRSTASGSGAASSAKRVTNSSAKVAKANTTTATSSSMDSTSPLLSPSVLQANSNLAWNLPPQTTLPPFPGHESLDTYQYPPRYYDSMPLSQPSPNFRFPHPGPTTNQLPPMPSSSTSSHTFRAPQWPPHPNASHLLTHDPALHPSTHLPPAHHATGHSHSHSHSHSLTQAQNQTPLHPSPMRGGGSSFRGTQSSLLQPSRVEPQRGASPAPLESSASSWHDKPILPSLSSFIAGARVDRGSNSGSDRIGRKELDPSLLVAVEMAVASPASDALQVPPNLNGSELLAGVTPASPVSSNIPSPQTPTAEDLFRSVYHSNAKYPSNLYAVPRLPV